MSAELAVLSIISKELMPNVLFIRSQGLEESFQLLVCTAATKERANWFIQVLRIPADRYQLIELSNEYDPATIRANLRDQLTELPFSALFVNITGGTKVMSSVVQAFAQTLDIPTRFYYWESSNRHVVQLKPVEEIQPTAAGNMVQLADLFGLHGFQLVHQESPAPALRTDVNQLFRAVEEAGSPGQVAAIRRARATGQRSEDQNFLAGHWFEYYTHFRLKETLKLPDDAIACNVKTKMIGGRRKATNDSEFDVVFLAQNQLYVVECKVYDRPDPDQSRVIDAIHRLASKAKSLGNHVQAILVLCHDISQVDNRDRLISLQEVCRLTGVKSILGIREIKNNAAIQQLIKTT